MRRVVAAAAVLVALTGASIWAFTTWDEARHTQMRTERFEQAYADYTNCMVGAPLEEGETLERRLSGNRLAHRWPSRCDLYFRQLRQAAGDMRRLGDAEWAAEMYSLTSRHRSDGIPASIGEIVSFGERHAIEGRTPESTAPRPPTTPRFESGEVGALRRFPTYRAMAASFDGALHIVTRDVICSVRGRDVTCRALSSDDEHERFGLLGRTVRMGTAVGAWPLVHRDGRVLEPQAGEPRVIDTGGRALRRSHRASDAELIAVTAAPEVLRARLVEGRLEDVEPLPLGELEAAELVAGAAVLRTEEGEVQVLDPVRAGVTPRPLEGATTEELIGCRLEDGTLGLAETAPPWRVWIGTSPPVSARLGSRASPPDVLCVGQRLRLLYRAPDDEARRVAVATCDASGCAPAYHARRVGDSLALASVDEVLRVASQSGAIMSRAGSLVGSATATPELVMLPLWSAQRGLVGGAGTVWAHAHEEQTYVFWTARFVAHGMRRDSSGRWESLRERSED